MEKDSLAQERSSTSYG